MISAPCSLGSTVRLLSEVEALPEEGPSRRMMRVRLRVWARACDRAGKPGRSAGREGPAGQLLGSPAASMVRSGCL